MTEQTKPHGGARPGAGRKATGRAASKALMIYLSDEENDRLSEALKKAHEKKSTFVRQAIKDRIKQVAEDSAD